MKLIWCTIWILGALLVAATLDAQPDPPAVNPSATTVYRVVHDSPCNAITCLCDSLGTYYPFYLSFVAANAYAAYRPSVRIVLTEQAADSSPPALQIRRKSFFPL